MAKNHLNTNKQFMIGNGILAFAVILVVVIFIYMSMKLQRDKERERAYTEVYHIELSNGFAGDSIAVYLNDSLLIDTFVTKDSLKTEITRFAEQSALLIVDKETEQVYTFNLSEKGGTIRLTRKDGTVFLTSSN